MPTLLWSEQDTHDSRVMPPAIHFSGSAAESGYGVEGGRKRCFLLGCSFPESLSHTRNLSGEQQSIRFVLHCGRAEGNRLLPRKAGPFTERNKAVGSLVTTRSSVSTEVTVCLAKSIASPAIYLYPCLLRKSCLFFPGLKPVFPLQ